MSLSLLVTRGNEKGQMYELTSAGATIGRELSNTICLTDLETSRRHCRIELNGRSATLLDLKSSNGTLLNGCPVAVTPLGVGDHISVGQTVFVVLRASSPASVPNSNSYADHNGSPSELAPELMPVADSDDRRVLQMKSDLQFMHDASLATSKKEIGPMLDNIVRLIFDWVKADRGCVLLRDAPRQPLHVRSMKQRDPDRRDKKFKISRSIARHVDENNVGMLFTDKKDSETLVKSKSFVASGVSEVLCVPIQGRNFTRGLIYIDRLDSTDDDHQSFNDDHLKLMHVIAHQTAIAIENEEFYSALLEKERMLAIGETAANLSHRIKNILQSINGGTHLVENGLAKNGLAESSLEMVRQGWAIVKRNQDRMSKLVMEMLLVNDQYVPKCRPTEILSLLTQVIQEQQDAAAQVGIKIEFRSDSESLMADVDPGGIGAAVRYVIGEAVKNSRGVEDAVVKVTLGIDSETVGITVRSAESEAGVPSMESHVNDIFSAAKQFFPGLELSAAQKILRGHQGDLDIKNEATYENYRIWFPLRWFNTNETKTSLTPRSDELSRHS